MAVIAADPVDHDKRASVARIHEENLRFYSTPDGLAVLKALELTFDEQWLYVFELFQNALDAGAKRVSITAEGDRFVLEHDGSEPIEARHVEGMSKLFRSTKGATTVGFMGIGLKSVFKRFRALGVCGFGWSFKFEVDTVVGDVFGDVQPDLIGAVLPVWSDGLSAPSSGFTTRFELSGLSEPDHPLSLDLGHVLDNAKAVLAALAWRGLRELRLGDDIWTLEGTGGEGVVSAVRESTDEAARWRVFPHAYRPSAEAIKKFLELRRLRPEPGREEEFADNARRERHALLVVPIDKDGAPVATGRGKVYATFPTQATLPFELHLNADWLLGISRTGLRELEDNAWQREIVNQSAHCLASYLTWIASLDQAGITAGYGLLRDPKREEDATLSSSFRRDKWRAALAELLRDRPVVPAFAEGKLVMQTFESVLDLPDELARVFDEPERRGDLLFGRPVLATKVLKKSGLEFLRWACPIDRLSASQAAEAVSTGVSLWWSALESDELTRLQVLAELWASFEKLPAFAKLPLVPTESNEWLRAEDAIIVDGAPRGESDIEREVLEFLRPGLPAPEKLVARSVLDGLRARSKDGRAPAEFVAARRWIDGAASKVTLDAIVRRRLEHVASEADPPTAQVVRIAQWARSVGRTGLLSYVVVDVQGVSRVVPIESALVAEPYVSTGAARRALHEGAPAISAEYVLSDPFGADLNVWRVAFETGKALGPLRVEARTEETWSRKEAEAFLGTELSDSSRWYSLTDHHFVPEIRECALSQVAPLLEEGTADRRSTSRREVSWFFRQPKGPRQGSDAAWLRVLKTLRWVPSSTGTLYTVDEVLLQPDPSVEDAPIARLSPSLAKTLLDVGIKFGGSIPTVPAIRRLARVGNQLGPAELAALMREAMEGSATEEARKHLREVFAQLTIPYGPAGARAPLDRVARRGALRGWIVALEELAPELRQVLESPGFPIAIPDRAGGDHALTFLNDVWSRAARGEPGLANEVRQVLPQAFRLLISDRHQDPGLRARSDAARSSARVFADKTWLPVAPAAGSRQPVYDDLRDRRVRTFLEPPPAVVTAGHLGDTDANRLATAEFLGIPRLSSLVTLAVDARGRQERPDWARRFDQIQAVLKAVRQADDDDADDSSVALAPTDSITVSINGKTRGFAAFLVGHELLISGAPGDFAQEAAKVLLPYLRLTQRGDLACSVPGLLASLDDADRFGKQLDQLCDEFGVDRTCQERQIRGEGEGERDDAGAEPSQERTPDATQGSAGQGEQSTTGPTAASEDSTSSGASDGTEEGNGPTGGSPPLGAGEGSAPEGAEPGGAPASGTSTGGGTSGSPAGSGPDSAHEDSTPSSASDGTEEGNGPTGGSPASGAGGSTAPTGAEPGGAPASGTSTGGGTSGSPAGGSKSAGSSHTREREIALLRARIAKLLKGEIEPSGPSGADEGEGSFGSDEEYRDAVVEFERLAGRSLTQRGAPNQAGWDLKTGNETERRTIEVKGKGGAWTEDEIVSISGPQAREAMRSEVAGESWWLYVVERVSEGRYRVLPIPNPVAAAGGWILRGDVWRNAVVDDREIDMAPKAKESTPAPTPDPQEA